MNKKEKRHRINLQNQLKEYNLMYDNLKDSVPITAATYKNWIPKIEREITKLTEVR